MAASEGSAPAPEASVWPDDDRVMVLIKFLPQPGKDAGSKVAFVPESCRACTQLHDPAFERFNIRESVIQLRVPRGRFLELAFTAGNADAARAFVNDQELALTRTGGRITLDLPPLAEDAVWAGAFATEIVETGVTLRLEHGDPVRRAGAYASGDFPFVERRAADNLTFAQREAIRRLGLGDYVAREKIGQIMLMGFDTNFPAAHTDAPPHVHMHLRWANNIGTQISHFYIAPDGLLTVNKVGIRGFNAPGQTLGRGQALTTIDRMGRAVYTHTITAQGALTITGPDGKATCTLLPAGAGFHLGVRLACGSFPAVTIRVEDDMTAGIITVMTGPLREVLRYDPQSGNLLSVNQPVSSPASTLNPD
ncbi:hypothetical protein [Novosphingobium sp.]|uniref:hypothetical protein n=1 Tax=Novosphingobium sp. TaxID=1874826 RepID=UPI002621C281|nr:hypothetical protein [Novosphingobium sp.]